MKFPFRLKLVDDWCDITHELEFDNPPWTLAKPEGVGAFQFTVALYQGGEIPDPSGADLLSMLREFAESSDLADEQDVVVEDLALRLAAASYRADNDFVRAWFVSDGRSFAQVTYMCAEDAGRDEVRDCERMIRTLQFGET